uniref:Uncharacterized protein n=1 Tax=Ciona intestinalis TaxID=7719 RepID=H2XQI4_CIOIN
MSYLGSEHRTARTQLNTSHWHWRRGFHHSLTVCMRDKNTGSIQVPVICTDGRKRVISHCKGLNHFLMFKQFNT